MTANKHVIAHHGAELEATARRTGAALRFEAAVGGGIPVLGPLATDLAANQVRRVRGIVNGTTNYILTAMADEGRDYEEVLAAAQARGLRRGRPERRRRGPRRGQQARHPGPPGVRRLARPGQRRIAAPPTARATAGRGSPACGAADIAAAAAAGRTIKLLAAARRAADGRIEASVVPTAVPADSALGRTGRRPEPDRDRGRTARHGRPSAGRAPAARRRAARSSATWSRSPAASARPGPALPPAARDGAADVAGGDRRRARLERARPSSTLPRAFLPV